MKINTFFSLVLTVLLLGFYEKVEASFVGAPLLYEGRSPESSMHVAISRNDIHIVRRLIQSGFDVNGVIDEVYGNTPLSIASYYGRYEIAEFLIKNGARVNKIIAGERSTNARTSLLQAIWKKQNKVAILLLQNGADPEMTSTSGRSACESARRYKNYEIMPHLPNCS